VKKGKGGGGRGTTSFTLPREEKRGKERSRFMEKGNGLSLREEKEETTQKFFTFLLYLEKKKKERWSSFFEREKKKGRTKESEKKKREERNSSSTIHERRGKKKKNRSRGWEGKENERPMEEKGDGRTEEGGREKIYLKSGRGRKRGEGKRLIQMENSVRGKG